MSRYEVVLSGCDDSTRLVMALTPEQVATLAQVETLCDAAGGGCKPTLTVREITPEEIAKHQRYERYDGEIECWQCSDPWPCTTSQIGGAA